MAAARPAVPLALLAVLVLLAALCASAQDDKAAAPHDSTAHAAAISLDEIRIPCVQQARVQRKALQAASEAASSTAPQADQTPAAAISSSAAGSSPHPLEVQTDEHPPPFMSE